MTRWSVTGGMTTSTETMATTGRTGGPGDDYIDGRRGADHVDGGPGIDQIAARDLSADSITCGDGIDSVAADPRDLVASDCENVRRAASMGLRLQGHAFYPTVFIQL